MRHDALFAELARAALDGPAVIPADVRRAVAADPTGAGAPEAARAFVAKAHAHAYKITDEDVAALRAAGLSEDEVYDLAVTAALGAGLARLDAARRSFG